MGLCIFEARVRLGDFSLQRVDLFTTNADIDVVAVRCCRGEGGTRLVHLCCQLHRVELRQDVARVHMGAFLDRNRYELAVYLRLDPDFRRPHDADDCGRRLGTTHGIDQNARGKREDDRNDGGTSSPAHVAVLS